MAVDMHSQLGRAPPSSLGGTQLRVLRAMQKKQGPTTGSVRLVFPIGFPATWPVSLGVSLCGGWDQDPTLHGISNGPLSPVCLPGRAFPYFPHLTEELLRLRGCPLYQDTGL